MHDISDFTPSIKFELTGMHKEITGHESAPQHPNVEWAWPWAESASGGDTRFVYFIYIFSIN